MGTRITAQSGTKFRVQEGGRVRLTTPTPASYAALSVNGTTSNTRGSSWGGPGNASIDMEVDYDFGSRNDARIFFDTGNELRLDLFQPTGTAQDNDWNASLVTRLGQVQMGETSTTSTGTSGLSSSVGHIDLTQSYQTIIDGTNIGTGTYTTNDVLIEARLNAAEDTVEVRVTLTDEHTNAFFDTVGGGAMATFTVLKASTPNGLVTPTCTVTNAF